MNRKSPLYLLLVCTLFLASPTNAGPFEDGLDAYSKGDYRKALLIWLPYAEKGVTDAQLLVATMILEGKGVKKNPREAFKWYKLAAIQGSDTAQYHVGRMFEQGLGVEQDETEAAKWYTKSASQGKKEAQFRLGALYMNGKGVDQDDLYALRYFRMAAESGHKVAQKLMGDAYSNAWFGLPRSPETAKSWYQLSKMPE